MRWYQEPGDFEVDGVLICGVCGKPKEDGIFPIIHEHQMGALFRKQRTESEIAAIIERRRAACFAGEFRELAGECRIERADSDTQPEALDAIIRFRKTMRENRALKMGRGLLFYGDKGRGKTFISGCLMNMLVDDGYKCLMTSIRRLKSQSEERFGSTNGLVEWLCGFDAVCLDDLFRERGTESMAEFSFTIIDSLYKRRVPMIITTNMSRAYMTNPNDRDGAILDRVKERCEKIEMTGRNRRQGRMPRISGGEN